jgi:hypothetical protein
VSEEKEEEKEKKNPRNETKENREATSKEKSKTYLLKRPFQKDQVVSIPFQLLAAPLFPCRRPSF